ncbi:glycoside hydrolase family 32 protein [Deinococcus antarcticus]|uniref:Glycoside hydrolase family 32 protein n=1 Tax=Deinococcus antarcticus TaxID=1298767 RepID=A0ABV8A8P3_9DEIO
MTVPGTLKRPNYRPLFHYAPAANWINDPNGLLYHRGLYHLYYQYNPHGDTHGNMNWGKATSPDLVHWKEHDVALPQHAHEIFSGSAVVDWRNTSGFGRDGMIPLVACYTGHTPHNQSQFLAYSLDDGERWTYHPEPVLDAQKTDFRDPKVFWHQPTEQWIMAIVHPVERQIELFGSPNLHDWTSLSVFGPVGATGGIWEVPELFSVVNEHGESHWVMKVDLNPGGPFGGSGVQYWLGEFDGVTFSARTPARWVDHGKDFYAAITFSGTPGRTVWLAWMNNWQYAQQVPTPGQRGTMSLPRVVTVQNDPEGPVLTQAPVPELTALRQQEENWSGEACLNLQAGQGHEFRLTWDGQDAATVRLKFISATGLEAIVEVREGILRLVRTATEHTKNLDGYAGEHLARWPEIAGMQDLHLFLDSSSLEVFGGGGRVVMTNLLYSNQPITEVEVQSIDTELNGQHWTLSLM